MFCTGCFSEAVKTQEGAHLREKGKGLDGVTILFILGTHACSRFSKKKTLYHKQKHTIYLKEKHSTQFMSGFPKEKDALIVGQLGINA